jgi:Ca2+/H+ antiporter
VLELFGVQVVVAGVALLLRLLRRQGRLVPWEVLVPVSGGLAFAVQVWLSRASDSLLVRAGSSVGSLVFATFVSAFTFYLVADLASRRRAG